MKECRWFKNIISLSQQNRSANIQCGANIPNFYDVKIGNEQGYVNAGLSDLAK